MPPITIFCPFTRAEHVYRWFDNLASIDVRPEYINLALIIDIGEDIMGQEVGALIYKRILEETAKTNFRNRIIVRNYDNKVSGNITQRRRRIAEIHNQSKDIVRSLDGQFILSLEDDTIFTNLCVDRLLQPFRDKNHVGLVTAYEAGRWNNKIIGIWGFDNVNNPKSCWTELPKRDYEEIDACGFYCYLTAKEQYVEHNYFWDDDQPWGPDVNYGLWLRQQGYINFVDWSQPCGHIDGGDIITPNNNLYVEQFNYDANLKGWTRRMQNVY